MTVVKILTLFGEEIILPEQVRGGKKKRDKTIASQATEAEKTKLAHKSKIVLPHEDSANPDKKYYTIGEVADIFQLKTSNIRFWTNEFNIKVRTTKKGDRLYTLSQLEELRTIYTLIKQRKFTINGAKDVLKQNKTSLQETLSLKQSLLQLRNLLMTLKGRI